MTTERHDERGADPGTIVESLAAFEHQHAADGPRHTAPEPLPGPQAAPATPSQPPTRPTPLVPATPVDAEPVFRPVYRPPVPRLTILDDGEVAVGQTLRLREETTVIGRTDGDVRLPHDPLVSNRHAEIVRRGRAGSWHWLLRDLGSSNGTFVACTHAPLRADRLVMLGSRRYRFRPPAAIPAPASPAGTLLLDLATAGADAWPALVEVGRPAGAGMPEFVLRGTSLVVGRIGGTNDVAIDDPLVALQAARIHRDAAGAWHIEAQPSRNGLWMQVMEVALAAVCRFQVGEQRFLFVV